MRVKLNYREIDKFDTAAFETVTFFYEIDLSDEQDIPPGKRTGTIHISLTDRDEKISAKIEYDIFGWALTRDNRLRVIEELMKQPMDLSHTTFQMLKLGERKEP